MNKYDIKNGDFENMNSSDDFKNEKMYAQDLYYLKQAFISNNKDNIKNFLASYFCNMPFKMPKKFEQQLNYFYFDNEIPTTPYEEKYIKANDYNFASMREYLYKLYQLGFFCKNINLDEMYAQFDDYFSQFYTYSFSINLEPFTAPPEDATYFNSGIIRNDGTISLFKDSYVLIPNLNLICCAS